MTITQPVLTPSVIWRRLRLSASLAFSTSPGSLSLAAVCGLALGCAPVIGAYIFGMLLTRVTQFAPPAALLGLLFPFIGITALAAIAVGVSQYADNNLSRQTQRVVQRKIFEALTFRLKGLSKLESPAFQDRIHLALMTAYRGPTQVVTCGLGILQSLATLFGFLIVLISMNPWFVAICIAAALPTGYAKLLANRRANDDLWVVSKASRRELFYSALMTSPQAAKELRLLGLGRHFLEDMDREVAKGNDARGRADLRERKIETYSSALGALISGGGLLWALFTVVNGFLDIGALSVFVAAVAGFQGSAGSLIRYLAIIHQSILATEHFEEILHVDADLPEPSGARSTSALKDGIEFHDVWFRYSEGTPWVLKGLNLKFEAGVSTALVGVNGAGKSTIVKLIARLYDPTQGCITWDGDDIRDLNIDSLRDRIAAVFQDHMLYEATLAENIGFGDLKHLTDMNRVSNAASLAGAKSFIDGYPAGFSTMLTRIYGSSANDNMDLGIVPSGGQNQRIAIARAFMREGRDVFVLDEPTSGLDALAEAEIHLTLRRLRSTKTSILISHRLNTIQDSDQIIVIDGGTKVQEGKHAQLFLEGGIYRKLFSLQADGYRKS